MSCSRPENARTLTAMVSGRTPVASGPHVRLTDRMSFKDGFSADEWATLEEAPLLAGARVIAADRGGTLRESFAVTQVYAAARDRRRETALLAKPVAPPQTLILNDMREVDDPVSATTHRVKAA